MTQILLTDDDYIDALHDDVKAVMASFGFSPRRGANPFRSSPFATPEFENAPTGTSGLEGTAPFAAIDEDAPFRSAYAWRFSGVHDGGPLQADNESRIGDLLGVGYTQLEVNVTGVTLVTVGDDGRPLLFQRYIDWLALFSQIGLTMSVRVGHVPDPNQVGNAIAESMIPLNELKKPILEPEG